MVHALMGTPKDLGYHFPAEWEKHESTWLSYPHNETSWPDKIHTIFPFYNQFIRELSKGETVNINVLDNNMRDKILEDLGKLDVDLNKIKLHRHATNDAWCRDHGPAFVVNRQKNKKAVVNWKYNGWGNKYPSELDDMIPSKIAALLDLPLFYPGIVMEGGSVDFNGQGTLLTTTACLLHKNRNPELSIEEIEKKLIDFYGIDHIIWLGEGIEGDDTDGHIDDLTRFISPDTVVTMVEPDKKDFNYKPLKKNLELLKKARLVDGRQLNIVEIPMPQKMYYKNQRLPVSYANFYISNASVIVPTYQCSADQVAIDILQECFPGRKVTGIDSVEIIWGLGSWHCLSQQEPAI